MREKQIEELAQVIAYSCIDLVESSCGEGECCVSCLATKLHKEGTTILKWVPVTERLPEIWQDVLTLSNYGKMSVDCVLADGSWCSSWICRSDSGRKITHWMPLPEAPKGE